MTSENPEQSKCDRREEDEPSYDKPECVLLFALDRDEFPDHGAGVVVQGYAGADTGAFQADSAAVAQSTVNMIVAGNQGSVFPPFPCVDDLPGIGKIFIGSAGLVFQEDLVPRNFVRDQIIPYGFRFADRLVAALSAGRNKERRRGILVIDLDCLIDAVRQQPGNLIASQKSCPMNDDIVKIPFPRNGLQQRKTGDRIGWRSAL